MKQAVLIVVSMIFSMSIINAQSQCPYITIDPDGYTNIRKHPNTSSKIIDKVYKYEVFLSIDDFCGNNMFRTGKWEPVASDSVYGYIYDKYIRGVTDLPALSIKNDTQEFEAGTISCFNDTLSVTMQIQKFKKWHSIDERLELSGMLHSDDLLKYMQDNHLTDTEIKEISIKDIRKDIKISLPHNKIKKYCNPHILRVYLGRNDEYYIYLGGGSGENRYGVWFSIVNGNIVYQIEEYGPC